MVKIPGPECAINPPGLARCKPTARRFENDEVWLPNRQSHRAAVTFCMV
jgi:hypothetical protein